MRLLDAIGFSVPQAVRAATQDYEESSDKVGQFIGDQLIATPQAEVKANVVHKVYQDWCWANGLKPEGFTEFKKSLASAGIEVKRKRPKDVDSHIGNKVQMIMGYIVKSEE